MLPSEPIQPPAHAGATTAAGAVVVNQGRVLLARLTYSRSKGLYMLPGGYVEAGETVDQAAMRETLEETGVRTSVDGLIGVRARVQNGESNTYCLFRLTYQGGTPRPHGHENDDVRWFSLEELEDTTQPVVGLARAACLAVLSGQAQVIALHQTSPGSRANVPNEWQLFL